MDGRNAKQELLSIIYKSRISNQISDAFETPPISKEEAIEFISAIGANRFVEIRRDGEALSSQETSQFIREAETFDAGRVINRRK